MLDLVSMEQVRIYFPSLKNLKTHLYILMILEGLAYKITRGVDRDGRGTIAMGLNLPPAK